VSGDHGEAVGKSVQWTDFSRERPKRKRRAGARRARTIFQWKIVSAERPIHKDRAA